MFLLRFFDMGKYERRGNKYFTFNEEKSVYIGAVEYLQ